MRGCDPNNIAAKLGLAMDTFKKSKIEIDAQWEDDAKHAFDEEFLVPLEPKVRRALEAIHHLADMLHKAERDCS